MRTAQAIGRDEAYRQADDRRIVFVDESPLSQRYVHFVVHAVAVGKGATVSVGRKRTARIVGRFCGTWRPLDEARVAHGRELQTKSLLPIGQDANTFAGLDIDKGLY